MLSVMPDMNVYFLLMWPLYKSCFSSNLDKVDTCHIHLYRNLDVYFLYIIFNMAIVSPGSLQTWAFISYCSHINKALVHKTKIHFM